MSETQAPVFVIDDDLSMRESLAALFRSAALGVETFASANEFLSRARGKRPGCLVLDVKLPGLSGLDLQQELAKAEVPIPIIFLTGYGDIPSSVRAIKSGALEFFTKPFDDESLLTAVRQALARTGGTPEKKGIRTASDPMVGESRSFRALEESIALVARTDASVLILGETGTGKELVARSIHARSARSSRPLVSVNCGAIQPSLIASELFGHEKGSFTGAVQQRAGRFELADGGTIFLDEIGEVPAETQVALLRVLQEREFERVGGSRSIRVDVRVIAATNRNLNTAVGAGSFRSDLFYRLNVFPIHVPPLRERRDDIPLLVEHFLGLLAAKSGKTIRGVDAKTMEVLQGYSWPGNIRELQNVLERWAVICDSEHISMDESWLPRDAGPAASPAGPAAMPEPLPDDSVDLRRHIEVLERRLIGRAMAAVGGNQSEAARRLGLSRGSLIERLKRYGPLTG
jgi:DNA-binding NtrC family response regulator